MPAESFAGAIRRQIEDGQLQAENYLLPERELAQKYGVSLRVVREGLAKLAAEKWIRRHQGKGTIVCERSELRQPMVPKNIAVILSGRVRDTSTAELFDGLQQGFQKHGYGTTLYVTDDQAEKETEIFKQLVQERAPGAVLFSAHPLDSFGHLARARVAGMKLVMIDHEFPEFDCDSVSVDDQLGGYEATLHLIRLGCAELVHLTMNRNWTSCLSRRTGFEMAAARLGVGIPARTYETEYCTTPSQLRAVVRKAIPEILKTAKRRLGIFALHDILAVEVLNCVRELGGTVPEEVAVVGFDNDIESALADVPLTTVEVPREEIAARAVELLFSQIEGERRAPVRLKLKPRLVIRQSCGCYPVAAHSIRDEQVIRLGRALQAHSQRQGT